jgi:hypothetical protein
MIRYIATATCSAAGLLAASPALASPVPTAAELASLCPASGPAFLVYGQTPDKLASSLKALEQEGQMGQGEAQFTAWSDRLYAVEWRKPSPDGDVNTRWLEELDDNLRGDGWKPLDRQDLKSSFAMEPRIFTKTVDGRALVIEIDAPGVQLIRCADLELLELDQRERSEDLAAGSPRPTPPPAPAQPFLLPDPKVCAKPEMIAAFSGTADPKDLGPLAEKHFQLDDPAGDTATYERRLGVWLRWTLRTAGAMSEEEIWALDPSGGKFDESFDTSMALIGTMGQALEAGQSRDGRRKCEATIAILKGVNADAQATARRERRANAILEAAAAKRGITLD